MAANKKSWWGRNWKWFVPVLAVGTVVLFVGFMATIVVSVFGLMKSSDAYKIAIATAKADSRVVAALGSPVQEGYFITGNINLNNDSGRANLVIPISGPKGNATIHVVATKSAGKWSFSKLIVQLKGSSGTIDLNNQPKQNKRDGAVARPKFIIFEKWSNGKSADWCSNRIIPQPIG